VVQKEADGHLDRRVVAALLRALDGNLLFSDSARKARGPALKVAGEKGRLAPR
jgi:hypothetical protein